MMTEKELNALSSTIYVAKLMASGGSIDDDDKRLRASGLFDDWAAGNHVKGDIYCTHKNETLDDKWEQVWECFQNYDNSVYPDIVPGNAAWYTFNRPLHGKTPETARPFVPVQGAHDMYRVNEYVIWTDGKLYRCKKDTNFSPTDYPDAWELVKEG
jgi:hypothetical protein